MPIRTLKSLSDVQALEEDWRALFEAAQHIHLAHSFPYILASARTRLRDREWRVFVVRVGNALTSGVFGVRSTVSVGRLTVPSVELGTEFVGDVLTSEEDVADLMRGILSEEEVPLITFGQLTQTAFDALRSSASADGLAFTWNHAGYGYSIDTTITQEALHGRMSRSGRQAARRKKRRVDEALGAKVESVASAGLTDHLSLFDDFVGLEAAGWKGQEGSAIRTRPGNEDYFRSIVETAASHDMMRWYSLVTEGRVIAMHMGIHARGVLWIPKIAFAEDFSAYSPGIELTYRVILACIDDPETTSINWIGAAEWLDRWRPDRIPYYRLRVFAPTALGRTLFAASRLQDLVRRHVTARGSEVHAAERRFL